MEQLISDSTVPTIELKTQKESVPYEVTVQTNRTSSVHLSNPSVSEIFTILPRSIMSYSYNIHIRHHPLRAGSSRFILLCHPSGLR